MSTVEFILRRKGRGVVITTPDATILDAAREMNTHRIGSLVVIAPRTGAAGGESAKGTVIGIVSERDILMRVVAAERDPRRTRVRDVMTSPVTFCTPSTEVVELRETMTRQRIRHVPVWCEDHGLCGLVSIGDLNALEAESRLQTINALEEYIVRG
jgi:CBS domain-containing protein